ncbi:MAG TPA: diaminopimelate epimerase [Chloroflexota bacterium]|nr:diaminopimelate epimerase [Chloroflexota bacterium]
MKFFKMQGTGNDFALIDVRQEGERDWPAVARQICDRHFGVGADGILLVKDPTSPTVAADYRMVMYNPDGTEAEMCGNGIRCFAKYLFDSGALSEPAAKIETGAGVLAISLEVEGGVARRATVDMGAPIFAPDRIPVRAEGAEVVDLPLTVDEVSLALTAVSMGNPHAVHFLADEPRDFPLERIGPRVEHAEQFPSRVNFEIARLTAPGQLDVRVWERGAGITLACGTGACAVFAAARRKGLVNGAAVIRLPGGELEMRSDEHGHILMTGPAELVFAGEWPGKE